MNKLPRLKSLFRPRRLSRKNRLEASQAHLLRQNLRALLLSKEHLASADKPTA